MSRIFTRAMSEMFLNEGIEKFGYTFDYDPITGGFITRIKKNIKKDLLDSTPVAAPSLLAEKVRKELSKISLLEFVIYMCEKMDESGVESFTTEYDYNDHHYTFSLKGRKNVE